MGYCTKCGQFHDSGDYCSSCSDYIPIFHQVRDLESNVIGGRVLDNFYPNIGGPCKIDDMGYVRNIGSDDILGRVSDTHVFTEETFDPEPDPGGF